MFRRASLGALGAVAGDDDSEGTRAHAARAVDAVVAALFGQLQRLGILHECF
jgi:hypothetical protein